MTEGFYEIRSNVKIARDVYEMTLAGDTSAVTAPGQFINIKLDGLFSAVRFRFATGKRRR